MIDDRIDVIVNERARHLGRGSRLREAIANAGDRVVVHVTRDGEELNEAARSIARRGSRGVVLAGGDGSYMAGVTALADAFGDALPPVAFAPGGTVCTIARAWGFTGSMERYTHRLLTTLVAGRGHATLRPSLSIREASGARRIGFIFGTGLVARFFDLYEEQEVKGNVTAARLASRIFAGSLVGSALATRVLTPTPCTLTIDGIAKAPPAYSLVAASVLRDLGLHLRLTYRAPTTSDRIHVVASTLPPFALGPQLARVLAGVELRGRDHVDELARSFDVRFTGPMCTYVLDGDLFASSEVHVAPGPELTVLGL